MDNLINKGITQEEKKQALQIINILDYLLGKYMVALTPEERQVLPRMSDKTLPFIEKAVEYITSESEFAPPYLDPKTMGVNLETVKELYEIYIPLHQIVLCLEDTITKCSSEAYVAVLSYYNNVKQAAIVNIPNAKSIYEDLKAKFDGQGKEQEG